MSMWVKWQNDSIVAGPQTPAGGTEDWYPLVLTERTAAGSYQYSLVNGQVIGVWVETDHLNVPATAADISAKHRELEASPVQVFGTLIDCDERSELRMKNTLTYWEDLPLEDGVLEEVNGEKVVIWTMGDNTTQVLNRTQLQAVFDEMLKQRAIRGAALFAAMRGFKNNPATTLRDIEEPSSWGI